MKFKKILNKIKRMPLGVKASFAFFMASMLTKGIAYITIPIYTRLLTSEEFGQISLFMTWQDIFGILAMFCLSYGVFNNGMINYSDKRDEFSFSMLILSNIITCVVMGGILVLYRFCKGYIKLDISLIYLMFLMFIFQPAYAFWTSKQRYELKYKWPMIWSIVAAIISPLVAILLIVSHEDNHVYYRLFGAEGALILLYLGFYIYIGLRSNWKLNTKYWKEAFLFNLPLIPHYLSTLLLNNSDKLMISYLVNDSATAYYSVAYSVAAVASIVWTAINGSLIPYTYQKCKEKSYSDINKVTIPLLLLFAVGCSCIILLAPEAVKMIATKEYLEAIYVIPPVIGGVFFQVLYFVFSNVVYYYKKPVYVMAGSVVSVILNIGLNYICISKWGYIAAGYTTLFCYLVQAAIDYIALRVVVRETIYNTKVVMALSIIVILVACVSPYLYSSVFIRYIALASIIIVCVVCKDKIKQMLSNTNSTKNN